MPATLVSGNQINRNWAILGGLGLVITAGATVVSLFTGKNAAGIDTHKVLSDGSVSQSGSFLAKSGSNVLHFDLPNNRLGIGKRDPKATLDVLGTMSGKRLVLSQFPSCTLKTSSSGDVLCGSDLTGASGVNSGGVIQLTVGPYVNVSGDTMTGSLAILNGKSLQVAGTITGSIVKALNSLSTSGTLIFEGSASGNTLHIEKLISSSGGVIAETLISGATLKGFGLGSCSNGTTSKVLYNNSTNTFSCGTDTDTDTNTTYTAGQSLTLTSTAFSLSSTISGSLLEFATVSGSLVNATKTLASSGSLVWEGAASGSSIYIASQLNGVGLTSCISTNKLLWTGGRFSCAADIDTDTNTTYSAGEGLTLTSTSFSLSDTISGTLLEFATVSGGLVQASRTLASSGTLVVEGGVTFVTALTVPNGGTGFGSCTDGGFVFGDSTNPLSCASILSDDQVYIGDGTTEPTAATLPACNNATDTLNYNATTNAWACGSDADTTYTAGQGLQLSSTSFRLLSTFSGAVITATTTLASSGTLIFEGAASGSSLYLGTSLEGAGLSDCDLATQTVAWDSTTKRFSCGTDADTTYAPAQGLSFINGNFRLNASHSGTVVQATTTLASSGGLIWEGAASGSSLYVASSVQGAGLTDCDLDSQTLNWDATTGRFSCLADGGGTGGGAPEVGTAAFSGAVQITGDTRYVKKQGDTMTGALIVNVTGGNNTTLGLRVLNTISGALLYSTKGITTSGSLVTESGANIDGTLYVSANNNRVGVGVGSTMPKTSLEVWGTVSGSTVYGSNSLRSSGGLVWNIAGSGGSLNLAGANILFSRSGSTIFNENSYAVDFRIEGDTDSGLFFLDASTDRVGIGTLNPETKLEVNGTISGAIIYAKNSLRSSGALVWTAAGSGQALDLAGGSVLHTKSGSTVFNALLRGIDFLIKGLTDANLFFVDASTDRVGIGTRTPRTKLEVQGAMSGASLATGLVTAGTLSGSVVRTNFAVSPTNVPLTIAGTGTILGTGSGRVSWIVPRNMSGFKLWDVWIGVDRNGRTTTTSLQIRNKNKGNRKLLTTNVTIDATETGSHTAATPLVINTATNEVGAFDYLYFDIPTVGSSPAPRGLHLILTFFKP